MRIPDSVVDEVSRRIDIVELVGNYVSLKQQGSRYVGLCPFHNEKTPSFSVDPNVGAYYCFGCQRGGGAFKFLMEIEGLTFPEAVRQLGEQVGVTVDAADRSPEDRRATALQELYDRVTSTFVHFLSQPEGALARKTLEERAVNNDSVEKFGLGFAPPDGFWLHRFLLGKGYSREFLEHSGLFTRANPERSLFSRRLIFPIRTRRGRTVAFGGRLLQGDGPKYINSPETAIYRKRENLFGLDVALQPIRNEKMVVLAEGYMDVIALHQAGVSQAVAPLGTAFTPEQASFLARYAERAILVFDGDSAGQAATRKTAELLEPHGFAIDVIPLDPGSDPADMLQSGGSRPILNALSSPLSILEFLVRTAIQERSRSGDEHMSSPRAKEGILRGLYPYVRLMESEVKRNESLRQLSDLLGVGVDAVQRDYHALRTGRKAVAPQEKGSSESSRLPRAAQSHDLYLMLSTVHQRARFAYVRTYVQPEDLEDREAREIYLALEECFRRGETELDQLVARILDPEIADMVRARLATGEFDNEADRAIPDAVKAIRIRGVEKKRRAVEAELRRVSASSAQAGNEYSELLNEKMILDRELQKVKGEGE